MHQLFRSTVKQFCLAFLQRWHHPHHLTNNSTHLTIRRSFLYVSIHSTSTPLNYSHSRYNFQNTLPMATGFLGFHPYTTQHARSHTPLDLLGINCGDRVWMRSPTTVFPFLRSPLISTQLSTASIAATAFLPTFTLPTVKHNKTGSHIHGTLTTCNPTIYHHN